MQNQPNQSHENLHRIVGPSPIVRAYPCQFDYIREFNDLLVYAHQTQLLVFEDLVHYSPDSKFDHYGDGSPPGESVVSVQNAYDRIRSRIKPGDIYIIIFWNRSKSHDHLSLLLHSKNIVSYIDHQEMPLHDLFYINPGLPYPQRTPGLTTPDVVTTYIGLISKLCKHRQRVTMTHLSEHCNEFPLDNAVHCSAMLKLILKYISRFNTASEIYDCWPHINLQAAIKVVTAVAKNNPAAGSVRPIPPKRPSLQKLPGLLDNLNVNDAPTVQKRPILGRVSCDSPNIVNPPETIYADLNLLDRPILPVVSDAPSDYIDVEGFDNSDPSIDGVEINSRSNKQKRKRAKPVNQIPVKPNVRKLDTNRSNYMNVQPSSIGANPNYHPIKPPRLCLPNDVIDPPLRRSTRPSTSQYKRFPSPPLIRPPEIPVPGFRCAEQPSCSYQTAPVERRSYKTMPSTYKSITKDSVLTYKPPAVTPDFITRHDKIRSAGIESEHSTSTDDAITEFINAQTPLQAKLNSTKRTLHTKAKQLKHTITNIFMP